MRMSCRRVVVTLAVGVAALVAAPAAHAATFGPGSLVIPMDTSTGGQNSGMLRAYGLVYDLLRNRVPVQWAINPAKSVNGNDFTVSSGTVVQLEGGAPVTLPRSYRGGPFVVAPADRAAALPIVQAWLAADSVTAVHDVVAGSVVADVSRTLIAAPRIAMLVDGYESIAFNDLNQAGIRDATGALWSNASDDVLTEAEVAGPTTTTDTDGALFDGQGQSRFCHVMAMHYETTSATEEVIQELRAWLDSGPLGHAFFQCEGTRVAENAVAGRFLTTMGINDDGSPPATVTLNVPSDPSSHSTGPSSPTAAPPTRSRSPRERSRRACRR